MNPEFRQTLNTISRNLESANEAAQENIYTFTQLYIDPCLAGFKLCITDCTQPCFPSREEQLRRKRGRSRGRAELNFDFYDDWDDDEDAGNGLLGWGNDELDSLLAGNRTGPGGQPGRQRAMSYGSRGRRKGTTLPAETGPDPTEIPGSSYLGFLERLPWKIGTRTLHYKPSAADLQVNPGGHTIHDMESEPLLEEEAAREQSPDATHGRPRSNTAGSRSTTNSLSSRGDLIMSDADEDAVPLDDDEFAFMLSRRITNTGSEDHASAKTASSGQPGASGRTTRTVSSKSIRSGPKSRRPSSKKSVDLASPPEVEECPSPTRRDRRRDEDLASVEQEMEVDHKRQDAQLVVLERTLSSTDVEPCRNIELKPDTEAPRDESVDLPSMPEARPELIEDDDPTQHHPDPRPDERPDVDPP